MKSFPRGRVGDGFQPGLLAFFQIPVSAREALAMWKDDYNTIRPRGLGNLAPVAYAKLSAPITQRDGALRYMGGSAPRPVASPSQTGSNQPGTLLIGG
jgi:putative transposase